MNAKKLVIYFLFFTLLSWFYFHYVIPRSSMEHNEEVQSHKILILEEGEEINAVSIEYEDNAFSMEKNEHNQWFLLKPVQDKADHFVVDGIASTIRIDKKVRTLNDTEFDFKAIGLSPPVIRVGIGYGEKKRYLQIGNETYLGNNYYAKWEDSTDVFIVSENFRNVFRKNLFTLREKKVFAYDITDIDVIAVVFANLYTRLEKIQNNEKQEWWTMVPYENRADDAVVTKYMRDLQGVRVISYHDDKSIQDESLGFSPENNSILIKRKTWEDTLFIGNQSSDGKYYYAYVQSKGNVIQVATDVIDALKKKGDYFVDKRIYPFESDAVRRCSYQKSDRTVLFDRIDNAWQKTSREEGTLLDDLNLYLDEIVFICAELPYEFMLAPEAMAELAVNEDDLIFSLSFRFGSSDIEPITFYFYTKDDMYIVKVEDDPNLFTIPAEKYDGLNAILKKIL